MGASSRAHMEGVTMPLIDFVRSVQVGDYIRMGKLQVKIYLGTLEVLTGRSFDAGRR